MNNAFTPTRSPQRSDFKDEMTALSLASEHPDSRVEIFGTDWSVVDRMRTRVAAIGLAHRVGVHHLHALICPLVHAALRRGGAKVVIVSGI
jgi:hypothetical protein